MIVEREDLDQFLTPVLDHFVNWFLVPGVTVFHLPRTRVQTFDNGSGIMELLDQLYRSGNNMSLSVSSRANKVTTICVPRTESTRFVVKTPGKIDFAGLGMFVKICHDRQARQTPES